MAWHNLVPTNTGGGRAAKAPIARVDKGGQLTLNHAAAAMIGTPDRIRVRFEDERCEIHIVPASPGDVGSFALSGGGNTSYRITMRAAVQKWPQVIGEYNVGKYQSGILLRKVEE